MLSAAKKPCTGCGSQISWDQDIREHEGIKGPLNLDGSPHRCEGFRKQKTVTDTITTADPNFSTDTPVVQEAKLTSAVRTEEWNKAHIENMESEKQTRTSIDNLSYNAELLAVKVSDSNERLSDLCKQLSTLIDVVKQYVGTGQDK